MYDKPTSYLYGHIDCETKDQTHKSLDNVCIATF